ncbi:MAG: amino acid adenylation domain-containing protein [Candidatus Eremiobacteraeota bacterium]|nr:amino acid adenylation domain-containing protein [Candidatus Eremiobacteraeota bacterium]
MKLDLVSLLSERERRQVLFEWNATERAYPDACVHELFETQVRRSSDAVAVEDEHARLSYAELNARANRLARRLRARGVGPDKLVGVCMQRSAEMLVALLAVFKAGGGYVPLDPEYPAERMAYVLGDSAPVLVLTHGAVGANVHALLARDGGPVVDVVADAAKWAGESDADLARDGLLPAHLAYVIYTSGSTGRPKGAMNEHRAVVNRLLWAQDAYALQPGDAVLQKTPFSFDVSVGELFWPLLFGARLVMAREDGHKDPDYLVRTVQERRITNVHFVPSMLGYFLDEPDVAARCTSLKNVFCSGEALTKAQAERFYERLPFVQLSNLYGPTEAAVEVTAWRCPRENVPVNVPIGKPIANTRMYVLDAHLEPVPVGVAGELYIGGVQVGRGYLNRPELTAERFVANPFVAGERLYKTGDLARFLPDGAIEYLGRNDFQVKIHGFRIELGEIEARLATFPGLREVAVTAPNDRASEKHLVAYYTAPEALDAQTLRAHLLAGLPEYMVPALYVHLEEFPRTSSGKLDRKALPVPGETPRAYEAPAGELETALAAIWSELLNVERVGRDDNFFELGGHSLITMRLANALKRYGLRLPSVAVIFQHPTVRALAAYFAAQPHGDAAHAAIPVRSGGTEPPLFLIHELFGDDLYFTRLSRHIAADVPVYGVPAVPLDEPQLHSVEEIAARKLEMILAVQPAGPYRIAGWSFGGVVAYEIAAQLLARGLPVEFLGLIDSMCPTARRSRDKLQLGNARAALRALLHRNGVVLGDEADAAGSFEELLAHCRERDALPAHLAAWADAEIRALCARVAAHLHAEETYAPPGIAMPIHLFAAEHSFPVAERMLHSEAGTLGWGLVAVSRQLHRTTVPGNHVSITTEHAPVLGRELSDVLCSLPSIPERRVSSL